MSGHGIDLTPTLYLDAIGWQVKDLIRDLHMRATSRMGNRVGTRAKAEAVHAELRRIGLDQFHVKDLNIPGNLISIRTVLEQLNRWDAAVADEEWGGQEFSGGSIVDWLTDDTEKETDR